MFLRKSELRNFIFLCLTLSSMFVESICNPYEFLNDTGLLLASEIFINIIKFLTEV
jgi:hypothetical protein